MLGFPLNLPTTGSATLCFASYFFAILCLSFWTMYGKLEIDAFFTFEQVDVNDFHTNQTTQ